MMIQIVRAVSTPPAVITRSQYQPITQYAQYQLLRLVIFLVLGVYEKRIASICPADNDDFHNDEQQQDIVKLIKNEIVEVGLKRWFVQLVCVCLEDEEGVCDNLMKGWAFIAKQASIVAIHWLFIVSIIAINRRLFIHIFL